jgi:hypothetical protein
MILVLDRAGWHSSQKLKIPEGLHLDRTYAGTLYIAYCRYEILHTIISFFQIDITFNVSLNKVTKY